MPALSEFVTPITSGLTPVGHLALSAERAAWLDERLRLLASARCHAHVASRTYVVLGRPEGSDHRG